MGSFPETTIALYKIANWELRSAPQSRRSCPLWVKIGHWATSEQCPLYPQKRTSELSRGMSALCQKRTSAISFDEFICAGRKRGRNLNVKRLCRRQIYDKLKLGRLHNRQVGRFGPLEDLAGIHAGLTIGIIQTRSIAHQSPIREPDWNVPQAPQDYRHGGGELFGRTAARDETAARAER